MGSLKVLFITRKKLNGMRRAEVIIIEDDPIVSYLHKQLIVKRNICNSPRAFLCGIKALEYLIENSDKNPDSVYLILLDLNMPNMSGWEFLDSLKQYSVVNRTEVIIVTSSPDREDRERAKKTGLVTEYLEKPLLDFKPVVKIKEMLEEKIQ